MNKKTILTILVLVLYIAFTVFFIVNDQIFDYAKGFLADHSFWSVIVYILFLVVAIIFPPLSAMPLILLAGPIFGPFHALVYNLIGWNLGAIITFALSRVFGKELIAKFISLDEIAKIEKRMGSTAEFWYIVLLRMMVPVDLLSYFLGIFTTVPFKRYALASFLGMIPFAVLYAYGSSALFAKNYWVLAIVICIGFAISFTNVHFHLYKKGKSSK